jgi:serine/threonine protein kinase/tetratricopeptide (TPR) repeat protein
MNLEAQRVRDVFVAAVQLPADRWEAFLKEACAGDEELGRHVSDLLREHQQAGSFLDQPAADLRATSGFDPATDGVAAAPQEGPGTIIGPYKLLELIGEGGMGTVWMAEQRQPVQRKVALKIIKAGMDTRQVVARFEAERQALALMDHPHIAKVLDGGTTAASRPYFVMELVKGTPITRYCDEHRLTPRERLELFLPVCQAIQHAHTKGIIHRDVKPANVLVAPYDGRPVPKVIDFGVAKATGQRLTERTLFTGFGAVVGTLEYMSPEQAELNNQDIDTRSDIYALGVLLYELLTGTTPLGRERLRQAAFTEVLRAVREEEPPRPSTRLSESREALPSIAAQRHMEPARLTKLVRGELDWIVMKALEKDRRRRYETASGLARDVEHYLADEPVQACPPTVGYRLRKVVRRNRGPVVAASLVLLALVAGIIGTTWGLVRANKARRDAVAAQFAEANRAEGESRAKDEAQKALEAERQAKDAETAQRLRAEGNAKLAMAVLDDIFNGAQRRLTLSTQEEAKGLARNPEREELERAYLEKGLDYYERLAQANATDWATRRAQAKAYARVGDIQLIRNNYTASEEAYRQAVYHMEQLARERPGDFDNAFDLANTYHWFYRPYWDTGRLERAEEITRHALAVFEKLAADFPDHRLLVEQGRWDCQRTLANVLLKAGKSQEAEKTFRQVRALSAELVAANPGLAELRDNLARSCDDLAQALQQTGQLNEAEKAYRQALAIWEKLGTDRPERPEYRGYATATLAHIAGLLAAGKRIREAEEAYRQVQAALEKRAADFPGDPAFQGGFAYLDWNLGNLLKDIGRAQEAEKAYRQALAIHERLAGDYPTQPVYRQEQAFVSWLLGGLLEGTGRAQEAEKAYRQAVAIAENLVTHYPDNADFRSRLSTYLGALAQNLLQQGKHAEAVKVADKIPGVLHKDANRYQSAALIVAGCMALAGKDATLSETDRQVVAQGYADRARELMQEAARRGADTPAARELREALRLPPDDPQAHYHLAVALHNQGWFAESEAECRQALRLRPDFPEARAKLGYALWKQGRNAEAEAECREALRLRPGDPEAYFTLGLVLYWGGEKPAAAARFYAEAFAAHPKLADDMRFLNRYNAACSAARAGCGQGQDAAGLDEAERARLRRQALDWLRADLAAWGQFLEKEPDKARPRVQWALRMWQQDTDFAGVRGEALAKLPEAERQAWQQLWADVEQTLKRVDGNDSNGPAR